MIIESDERSYKTSNIVALGIGLLLLIIASTIILSLIPLYLPQKSVNITSGNYSCIILFSSVLVINVEF